MIFFQWILAIATDIVAFALVLILYLLSFFSPKKKDPSFSQNAPVLLVHGYLNTSSVWRYVEKKLIQAHIGPIFTIDLKRPFGNLQGHVKTLSKKIAQIEKLGYSKKMILIGHSMGGLVSALYALDPKFAGKVSDVITIGSPLQGTYLAFLGLGHNARQMRVGSSILQTLHLLFQKNKEIRFYHILSRTDTLITPFTSASIEGKLHVKKIFSGIGHVGLLYSPLVCRKIVQWIRSY